MKVYKQARSTNAHNVLMSQKTKVALLDIMA